MKRLLCGALLLSTISSVYATICPDPANSSLQQGIIPQPWKINPFSENTPQGELESQFTRANVLVAGLGMGIICTYENTQGCYSIWWETNVKIPSNNDNHWRNSLGGFECTDSLEECVFYTAKPRN